MKGAPLLPSDDDIVEKDNGVFLFLLILFLFTLAVVLAFRVGFCEVHTDLGWRRNQKNARRGKEKQNAQTRVALEFPLRDLGLMASLSLGQC